MTVKELKKAIDGVPDDCIVRIRNDGGWYIADCIFRESLLSFDNENNLSQKDEIIISSKMSR